MAAVLDSVGLANLLKQLNVKIDTTAFQDYSENREYQAGIKVLWNGNVYKTTVHHDAEAFNYLNHTLHICCTPFAAYDSTLPYCTGVMFLYNNKIYTTQTAHAQEAFTASHNSVIMDFSGGSGGSSSTQSVGLLLTLDNIRVHGIGIKNKVFDTEVVPVVGTGIEIGTTVYDYSMASYTVTDLGIIPGDPTDTPPVPDMPYIELTCTSMGMSHVSLLTTGNANRHIMTQLQIINPGTGYTDGDTFTVTYPDGTEIGGTIYADSVTGAITNLEFEEQFYNFDFSKVMTSITPGTPGGSGALFNFMTAYDEVGSDIIFSNITSMRSNNPIIQLSFLQYYLGDLLQNLHKYLSPETINGNPFKRDTFDSPDGSIIIGRTNDGIWHFTHAATADQCNLNLQISYVGITNQYAVFNSILRSNVSSSASIIDEIDQSPEILAKTLYKNQNYDLRLVFNMNSTSVYDQKYIFYINSYEHERHYYFCTNNDDNQSLFVEFFPRKNPIWKNYYRQFISAISKPVFVNNATLSISAVSLRQSDDAYPTFTCGKYIFWHVSPTHLQVYNTEDNSIHEYNIGNQVCRAVLDSNGIMIFVPIDMENCFMGMYEQEITSATDFVHLDAFGRWGTQEEIADVFVTRDARIFITTKWNGVFHFDSDQNIIYEWSSLYGAEKLIHLPEHNCIAGIGQMYLKTYDMEKFEETSFIDLWSLIGTDHGRCLVFTSMNSEIISGSDHRIVGAVFADGTILQVDMDDQTYSTVDMSEGGAVSIDPDTFAGKITNISTDYRIWDFSKPNKIRSYKLFGPTYAADTIEMNTIFPSVSSAKEQHFIAANGYCYSDYGSSGLYRTKYWIPDSVPTQDGLATTVNAVFDWTDILSLAGFTDPTSVGDSQFFRSIDANDTSTNDLTDSQSTIDNVTVMYSNHVNEILSSEAFANGVINSLGYEEIVPVAVSWGCMRDNTSGYFFRADNTFWAFEYMATGQLQDIASITIPSISGFTFQSPGKNVSACMSSSHFAIAYDTGANTLVVVQHPYPQATSTAAVVLTCPLPRPFPYVAIGKNGMILGLSSRNVLRKFFIRSSTSVRMSDNFYVVDLSVAAVGLWYVATDSTEFDRFSLAFENGNTYVVDVYVDDTKPIVCHKVDSNFTSLNGTELVRMDLIATQARRVKLLDPINGAMYFISNSPDQPSVKLNIPMSSSGHDGIRWPYIMTGYDNILLFDEGTGIRFDTPNNDKFRYSLMKEWGRSSQAMKWFDTYHC